MVIQHGKPQSVVFDGNISEVVVRSKIGQRIVGRFAAISPLTNRKRQRGIMQQDIFDLLDQVSKGAFSVFNNLKFNRSEENNITQYTSTEEMTKTDKEVLSRRIRELKNVGLIRSLSKKMAIPGADPNCHSQDPRKTFIINPEMIRCIQHDVAVNLWNQCGFKGGKA